MKVFHILTAAAFGVLTAQCLAQTTLKQIFEDLHSPDPQVRAHANSIINKATINELPTISTETETLCTGLTDSDAYIRQQASGILSVLAQLYPQDAPVVAACTPQLIQAGNDAAPRVRRNALNALEINAGGPPAISAAVFKQALADPDTRVKQLGAIGMMRLQTAGVKDSTQLVSQAIASASDEAAKEALLLGVAQSRITDKDVAQAARQLFHDPSASVQLASILAYEGASPDKASAAAVLQGLSGTNTLSAESKQTATEAIRRLKGEAGTH